LGDAWYFSIAFFWASVIMSIDIRLLQYYIEWGLCLSCARVWSTNAPGPATQYYIEGGLGLGPNLYEQYYIEQRSRQILAAGVQYDRDARSCVWGTIYKRALITGRAGGGYVGDFVPVRISTRLLSGAWGLYFVASSRL